ncbi:methylated-DNA--protein-cysteine methyltransferase [Allostella humosa]|nr:methylated-DNA--[protein]-cysteine S-methyltransferase [Stella humosa]BBK33991.1 methylated-DNA--protein-cysteine methyltransferase [Stella humosa]
MRLHRDRIETPIGAMLLLADDRHLRVLEFEDQAHRLDDWVRHRFGRPELVDARDPLGLGAMLAAYFAGRLEAIDAIAAHAGGTPFQETVWAALRAIPAGETRSYGSLAAAIGRPAAQRAVGAANGRNPLAVVIPCHRLLGSNGALTGYGGGITRKRWLLAHEGARISPRA